MSLRFVYGRSGSGKSQFCFNEIKEKVKNKETVFMITPEQFSFTAEQKLLEAIDTGSSIYAEVISFGRIAHRVIGEIGEVGARLISENGKKMLLYNIISKSKDNLTFLGSTEENAEIIGNALTEMKKHCVSRENLQSIIEKTDNMRLKLKLQDIYYCFDEFQKVLGENFIEENDILSILKEKLPQSKMFKNAFVYIDEFSGFTTQEYEVIKEIIKQAKQVTITLVSDDINNNKEEYLFYTNNKVVEKLGNNAEFIYLKNQPRFKNDELHALEQNIYAFPEKRFETNPKHIHISIAENPYEEIEAVARNIAKLVQEEGYSYKDIGVITKSSEQIGAMVKAIFRSYDIPCFIDEKKDLSQNILIRFILSSLEILSKSWKTETVISSIKTGLYNLTDDEIYDLEKYAYSWGIKGKRWYEEDFEYGFINEDEKIRINDIRNRIATPLIHLKEELNKQKTIKDISSEIYEYLKEMNVEETLNKKIQMLNELGEIEVANEYITGMQILINALDEMVDLLGNEKISFEKYMELLKICFSGNVLGTIPATLDQVIVGDIDRSRSHKVKAVFIIGLNDGVFPEARREEGFLNDNDRKVLKDMGIELAKDSVGNLLEEQFSIYKAFSTAEEEIFLSYPVVDKDGIALRPSILISKIKKIFPKLEETKNEEIILANKKIIFEELLTKMQGEMDEKWQTILELFENDPNWNSRLKSAKRGLEDTNLPAHIEEKNIKKLYGNVLKTSVSRLEQYRKCPFSFHLKYGLKLKEEKDFNLKAIDTGTFMHETIARFFDVIEERNIDYKNLDDEKTKKLVQEVITEQLNLSKNDLFRSTPKFQSLTRRLSKVITKAIKYIIEQLKNSDFDISGSEIEFSDKSSYEPIRLELDTGEKIEVTGKIDRIDIAKTESGKYLRIIDYKSSARSIDLNETIAGLQIQLLTYLDAATEIEKAIPAGIFYFGLIDKVIKSEKNKSDEEIEEELKKEFRLNGILLADVNVARMMDRKLEKGYSNIIPAFIDKEGNLSNASSNVVTLDQFKDLQKHTKKIIKEISKEILSGNIDIKPYKGKNKNTACDYCPYKSICNFSPDKKGNEYFRIKTVEKQELLEQIK